MRLAIRIRRIRIAGGAEERSSACTLVSAERGFRRHRGTPSQPQ
jgi:hypothetical protein